MSRNLRIVLTVLLLHGAALWALQTGLLRRTAELLIPAMMLADMAEPAVKPEPEPPAPPVPVRQRLAPTTPTPLAVAKATPEPSPEAPAPVAPPTPVVGSERPLSTNMAPVVVAAAPRIELPSSDADYLSNPKPPYPPMSKRLGEQGKVVIRTLIGADGVAQEASIHQSSGYDRLDQAALATARKWRYVPGKRAGVAEAMWFNVPFTFILE